MKLDHAEFIAEELLKNNFVEHYGFKFNNRKRACGLCSYKRKAIYLSRIFTENNSYQSVIHTILHEIAHVLSYDLKGESGHGRWWKYYCRQLGISSNRTHPYEITSVKKKYKAYCPSCDKVITYRHRRSVGAVHTFCRTKVQWLLNK